MKELFILIILASLSNGIKYDGLRARFALTSQFGTKEFFRIPRTVPEAEAGGWVLTECPPGPLQQLRMLCYPGRIVCALYTDNDFIAGLQVAIPVESIAPALKPEMYFIKWSPPAAPGEAQKDYWSALQLYVSEEYLKAGGPTLEDGSTLQARGVWVNDVDGTLMKISISQTDMRLPFRKQRCVSRMGLHYYYNVTKEFDCKAVFMPWFAMFADGDLTGVGFQTYGSIPPVPSGGREWFEHVPRIREATLFSMQDASDCMKDNNVKYGSLSLHFYYVDKPWDIICDKQGVASLKQ